MRLSAEQELASKTLSGAVRVVAGAGTGKTAVIAERFRRLVAAGNGPESILVMTFSERAAAEMKARIVAELGDPGVSLAVGTFHALALSWLREDGWRVGVPVGFEIVAGAERWILARELMWELGLPALVSGERPDELVAPLLKLWERLKQELVPLERLEAWCRNAQGDDRAEYLAAAVCLFRALGERCRAAKLLDFDDLLLEAVRLLEQQPVLRAAYSRRYLHLMVDEYQDTNLAQERLVELLGSGATSVFVVGDDDQSIYRFRGASRANLERFLDRFPTATTLHLGSNRRSSASIVGAASSLIAANPSRLPKQIRAVKARGRKVELSAHADGLSEAAWIAQAIAGLRGDFALSAIAILIRTNALARPLVTALEACQLAFRLKGALGFYERAEVKDVIALLRLLRDPDDRVALVRLLARPPLALPDDGLRAVAEAAEPMSRLSQVSPVPRAWAAAVCELQELVPKLGVEDLLFEAMERTRQLEALLDVAGPDPGLIAANVSRFAELVADFCARRSDHSLAAFLDHLELVLLSGAGEEVAEPEPGDQEAVQVMTIHQAKGLEFEAVFVPALVEGRLPQAAWRDSLELPAAVLEPSIRAREDHVAEERRLLYVAMTRARSRLFLSWAERYEGSRRWRPSRFLAEVESAAIVVDRTSPPALDSSVELVAPVAPVAPVGRVSRASHGPGAKAPADEIPILSFSAVASYRECPRQYWYKHALRLPAEQSAEAQLGSAVHQALMWAGALRRDGKQLSKDTLHDLYRRGWSHGPCSDERRRPVLEAIGWRQLKGYLDAGGLAARPYLVEHSFTADLDGWRLRGIIDRIDFPPPTQNGWGGGSKASSKTRDSGPGAWRLIDYKTGTPMPASRLRRDLQLALYALGAREALGLDPLELEIVYLKTGQRVTMPASDELLDEARRIGAEVAAGVRAGAFEARPERRRCQLCPYRLACTDAL